MPTVLTCHLSLFSVPIRAVGADWYGIMMPCALSGTVFWFILAAHTQFIYMVSLYTAPAPSPPPQVHGFASGILVWVLAVG